MLSIIVHQNVFDYRIFDKAFPTNLICYAKRAERLLRRDTTTIFYPDGKVWLIIKHPFFFELKYNIRTPKEEYYGHIKSRWNNSAIMTTIHDIYELKIGEGKSGETVIAKNGTIIGKYKSLTVSNSESSYEFNGENLDDLLCGVIIFMATDSWGI